MTTQANMTTTPLITTAIVEKIAAAWAEELSAETVAALLAIEDGDEIPELINTDGDDIERWGNEWENVAVNTWDDDGGERIYQLADGVFAHIGNYVRMISAAKDIHDFLSNWDHDSYGTFENLLTAFGLEPELDEAGEDYDGECKVWIKYNYYDSHINPPQDNWAREDDSCQDIIVFDSFASAQEWIDETESSSRGYHSETNPHGCYLLSHGEYAPPDYTICKA